MNTRIEGELTSNRISRTATRWGLGRAETIRDRAAALSLGLLMVVGSTGLAAAAASRLTDAASDPTIARRPAAGYQSLTFEQRVTAQRAIEQVYWHHRLWPKEHPLPKPALSAVLPDTEIRARVEDYLKRSSALESFWRRPITAAQLQAEMDRMAAQTRDARLLSE